MAKDTSSKRQHIVKSNHHRLTTEFDANHISIDMDDQYGDCAIIYLTEHGAKKLRKQLDRFLALRDRLKKEVNG